MIRAVFNMAQIANARRAFQKLKRERFRQTGTNTRNEQLTCTKYQDAAESGCLRLFLHRPPSKRVLETRNVNGESILHIATRRGYLDIVKACVNLGADIRAIDKIHNTLLHKAADRCDLDIFRYFLELELNPDRYNRKRETPLHIAIQQKNLALVKLLVDLKVNLNARDNFGYCVLHRAVRVGNIDIVQKLIQCGSLIHTTDNDGNTPLHDAIKFGNLDIISCLLLTNQTKIDFKNLNGNTALHYAVLLCKDVVDVQCVCLLKDVYGANVTVQNKSGYTPLHLAAHFNRVLVARELLRVDDVHTDFDQRDQDLVTQLKNCDGDTALHCAARSTKVDTNIMHQYYVQRRSRANQGILDSDPLNVFKSEMPCDNMILLLLHRGFVQNAINEMGDTPLEVAKKTLNKYTANLLKAIEMRYVDILSRHKHILPKPSKIYTR
jgi:ankyrin repeat protein